MTSSLPYRPCVGIMLLNHEGLVFMGKRLTKAGNEHVEGPYAWQMPQGGIDEGESPYEAAVRELREETNIHSVSVLAESPRWYDYDLPGHLTGRAWKGRYRGQTQKWFALRFEGDEAEINLASPAGGHKPEFESWRWETMDRLADLVIPFKRPVYEAVVQDFRHLVA